jgi:hypothetical protein
MVNEHAVLPMYGAVGAEFASVSVAARPGQ